MSAVAALQRRVAELEAEAEICRRLAGFCDGGPDRDRVLMVHRVRDRQLLGGRPLPGDEGGPLVVLRVAQTVRGALGGAGGRGLHGEPGL